MVNQFKQSAELRKSAEAAFLEEKLGNLGNLPPEEIQSTFEKLRIRQIELEMHNEELLRRQAELEIMQARYSEFYNQAPVGYLALSDNWIILKANLTVASLLGQARSALVNQPLAKFILKEDQDAYFRFCRQLKEVYAPQNCDLRLVRSDGDLFWVELIAIAAHYTGCSPKYQIVLNDISDRKHAEEILRESEAKSREQKAIQISEARFREILENSLDASYKRSLQNDSYEFLSPVAQVLTGYTLNELMEMSTERLLSFIHPDDFSRVEQVLADCMSGSIGKTLELEYRFKHKNGEYRWFHDRFTVVRDEDDCPLALIGSVSDITDRKSIEEERQNILQEKKTILDTANVGVSLIVGRKLVWVNRKMSELFQYDKDELEGQSTRILYPSQEAFEQMGRETYPVDLSGCLQEPEQQLKKRDGSLVWTKFCGRAIDPNNLAKGIVWILEDITARKQSEQLLEESNENYRRIFENQMIAINVFDAATLHIIEVNDALVQLYGYSREELLAGMKMSDLSAEKEESIKTLHQVKTMPSFSVPLRYHKKQDGTIFPVEIVGETYMRGDRLVMFIMIKDISQRKRVEDELMHAHGELERKVQERTADLEKTNATLSMMLDYARKTEADIQERVVANLRSNIMGIVDLVQKQQLPNNVKDLIDLLKKTTQNLAHPLARTLESPLLQLTAREIQLANLIRLGKTTKELMVLLDLSESTIESHRNNLRRKLGLHNKKINLRTFLNAEFQK